jgi:hypothetical protein
MRMAAFYFMWFKITLVLAVALLIAETIQYFVSRNAVGLFAPAVMFCIAAVSFAHYKEAKSRSIKG